MAMTVKKRKDTQQSRVLVHKIADVRGGVSIATEELVKAGIDYIPEGAIISRPWETDDMCRLCVSMYDYNTDVDPVDIIIADGKGTIAKETLLKKYPFFLNNDSIIYGENKTYVAEFSDEGDSYTIKCEDAPDGDYELLFNDIPYAVVGTGKPVKKGHNVDTDAWLSAVVRPDHDAMDFDTECAKYETMRGIIVQY